MVTVFEMHSEASDVAVADIVCNFPYTFVGIGKQLAGCLHTHLSEIFGEGHSHTALENNAYIGQRAVKAFYKALKCHIFGIVSFDMVNNLCHTFVGICYDKLGFSGGKH